MRPKCRPGTDTLGAKIVRLNTSPDWGVFGGDCTCQESAERSQQAVISSPRGSQLELGALVHPGRRPDPERDPFSPHESMTGILTSPQGNRSESRRWASRPFPPLSFPPVLRTCATPNLALPFFSWTPGCSTEARAAVSSVPRKGRPAAPVASHHARRAVNAPVLMSGPSITRSFRLTGRRGRAR